MSKDEALWVSIRAVGLVFLGLCIIYTAKLILIGTYYLYITDFVIFYNNISEAAEGEKMARQSAQKMLLDNSIEFILFAISANYFMRHGKFVHRVISR